MSYPLFLILGLGAGAVYATVALGVVLEYRASGVLNFAQGALAMYFTMTFAVMRSTGVLVLPIGSVTVTSGPAPFIVALLVTLALAAVFGLVIYQLLFRPLRTAPPLAGVVVSVGLMLALLSLAVLRFGTGNQSFPAVLPADPVHILGVYMPRDRLLLAGVVVVATVLLWAFYRFTSFGVATRAAAEDEKGAMVLGYSPTFIASVNWVLACLLAAIGGILAGPITALDPETFALVIVPALGAALIGRFQSFGWTAGAALGIGMLQSEILKLQSTFTWLPKTGLQESIPFIIIIIVLFLLGKRLPTRGTLMTGRFPSAPSPRRVLAPAAVLTLVAGLVLTFAGGLYRVSLIVSMEGALICLSLVLLTGLVGQISLAQMSFAGAAGFTLGAFATNLHVPFPIAPLLAALVAAVLGLLVGVSALRIRGIHLAVATIGLAVAISALWFEQPSLTGGFSGTGIPTPTFLGLNLGISGTRQGDYPRVAFGLLTLAVVVLVALAVINLRRGSIGRRLLAVRANERAAATAGVNVAATKLLAFTLSAFVAGIGGAMLGYQQGKVAFQAFDVFVSLSFLAFAYLGGITTVTGALIGGALVPGGIVFTVINQWISITQYEGLIGGLGLIVTAIANPEGIAGAAILSYALLSRRLRHRPSPSGPPLAGYPHLATAAEPADTRVAEVATDGPPSQPTGAA